MDFLTGDVLRNIGVYAPSESRLIKIERDDLAADYMRFDAATSRLDFG
jgi:hypothetical protein